MSPCPRGYRYPARDALAVMMLSSLWRGGERVWEIWVARCTADAAKPASAAPGKARPASGQARPLLHVTGRSFPQSPARASLFPSSIITAHRAPRKGARRSPPAAVFSGRRRLSARSPFAPLCTFTPAGGADRRARPQPLLIDECDALQRQRRQPPCLPSFGALRSGPRCRVARVLAASRSPDHGAASALTKTPQPMQPLRVAQRLCVRSAAPSATPDIHPPRAQPSSPVAAAL